VRITVIGSGYVGLVSGACLADTGNDVLCLDVDERKIEMLKRGEIPIYEPGLEALVRRNAEAGRLRFTTDVEESVRHGLVQFVAVGTPPGEDGSADLKHVTAAARSIGKHLDHFAVIVDKSTVPVGTADRVRAAIAEELARRGAKHEFAVVSNPEFLKEGAAVQDFMKPDRIVIGSDDERATQIMRSVYLPFQRNHERMLVMDVRSAELTKYAANAMLATRISFMNDLANLAECLGADIEMVRQGIGADPRIGYHFLYAGTGYGGSCFPKDVKALAYMASVQGRNPQLLQAVMDINEDRRRILIEHVESLVGALAQSEIGLMGLAFKSNTDDIRESPALSIAAMLKARGANVRAYDPVAMENTARIAPGIRMCRDPYELAEGVDALVVINDWNEFKQLDLAKIFKLMRHPNLIDGRNIYEPEEMKRLGFRYRGIGRGYNGAVAGAPVGPGKKDRAR
jgi:UDPglucose 6-dehydrogenase